MEEGDEGTSHGPTGDGDLLGSPACAGAEDLAESPAPGDEEDGGGEDEGEGFSFPVPPLAADACIVPVYPIFGRPPSPAQPGEGDPAPVTATLRVPLGRLLLEEREFRARQKGGGSTSAGARSLSEEEADGDSDGDGDDAAGGGDEELKGVPPESYCLWAPGGQSSAPASPRRCRKSGSTGSVLRWRRISERLVGRSHSDGKEKFVFLNAPGAGAGAEPPRVKVEEDRAGSNKGGDAALGQRWAYHGKAAAGVGGSGRRRSYLPYKQELVGLFANVSGLRRSYHPF
ncbi:hypothetical protein ACP4OV_024836 [Aristida adscensionis]